MAMYEVSEDEQWRRFTNLSNLQLDADLYDNISYLDLMLRKQYSQRAAARRLVEQTELERRIVAKERSASETRNAPPPPSSQLQPPPPPPLPPPPLLQTPIDSVRQVRDK